MLLTKCREKKMVLLRHGFSKRRVSESNNPIKKQRKALGNLRYPFLKDSYFLFAFCYSLSTPFLLLWVTGFGSSSFSWAIDQSLTFWPHSLRSGFAKNKLPKMFRSVDTKCWSTDWTQPMVRLLVPCGWMRKTGTTEWAFHHTKCIPYCLFCWDYILLACLMFQHFLFYEMIVRVDNSP